MRHILQEHNQEADHLAHLAPEGQRPQLRKETWYDEFGTSATRQTKEVDVVLWSKVWAETSGSQSESCSAHDDVLSWQLRLWEPVF